MGFQANIHVVGRTESPTSGNILLQGNIQRFSQRNCNHKKWRWTPSMQKVPEAFQSISTTVSLSEQYAFHPESKAHVFFCPYSSHEGVPNLSAHPEGCNTNQRVMSITRLLVYHNKRSSHPHTTYSGPCSPLLGKILRMLCLLPSSLNFKSNLRTAISHYTAGKTFHFQRNQTEVHDYPRHKTTSILQYQCHTFPVYHEIGLYSSHYITKPHPHFCHRQDVESKDVRISTFIGKYMHSYRKAE